MKKLITVFSIVTLLTVCGSLAGAVVNYSGDESGFNAAITGLPKTSIGFEELNIGDVINDQYAPPVIFSAQNNLLANTNSHGTAARSGNRCADLERSTTNVFKLLFDKPVWGASFWVLDVEPDFDVKVYGIGDVLLDSYSVSQQGLYTFVAVLSDIREIVRIEVVAGNDGIGFDDVTVVTELLKVEMVLIPGGEFEMGDHHDGMTTALPVHTVSLGSFYIGKYEITNRQYCDYLNTAYPAQIKVVGGIVYATDDSGNSKPYCDTLEFDTDSRISFSSSTFTVVTGKENHPVVEVSWYGAKAFCDYYDYRLPTEAEWEYAARGGLEGKKYSWGDSIDGSKANYLSSNDSFEPGTTPVGYYDGNQTPSGIDMANGYGLYDMVGNVYEWCNDWYDAGYYSTSPYDNPQGPVSNPSDYRVTRGGGWVSPPASGCIIATRVYVIDDIRGNDRGFRVAKSVEPAYEPEMVVIPAGWFPYQNTTPEVFVEMFYIGKYETTNTEYCQFLNANDPCGLHYFPEMEIDINDTDPYHCSYSVQEGKENYPIRYLTLDDVNAYAQWLSTVEGATYRLPTEQEWEKAAAWDPDEQHHYIYGFHSDSIDCSKCNYNLCVGNPTEVGSYPYSSYYGCYDMSGNVWEMTSSISGGNTVTVGGYWETYRPFYCQTTSRGYDSPSSRYPHLGFRVARDVLPCWVEQDKLLASDRAAGDTFGNSVGISGDIAILGAYSDDDNGTDSGSAYLFDVTTGSQIAKLTASDGAAGDYFGVRMAISGNIAIVGAFFDDDDGTNSGSAYLFDTATGSQLAKLTADEDAAGGDNFGADVAISGTTAIVGAYGNDDNGTDSGSAYLFDISDPCNPVEITKLTASDPSAGDYFGEFVAINGDFVIVGAPYDDDAGTDSGSAYIFKWDGVNWVEQQKLTASNGAADDLFGFSMAISGNTAIVGSHHNGAADSGSAYLFDMCTGNQLAILTASDAESNDYFGMTVDISGNIAIVGAHHNDDDGSDSGSAYLFDISDLYNPIEIDKIIASDAEAMDQFGIDVAISGDTAIVGAYLNDDKGTNSGSAYVFKNVCNTSPVAVCQDLTVSADSNCEGIVTAEAIDDSSYDPDGDPITLSVDPAGPYPLGDTIVTLTVSDGELSATCEATITVVDTTDPVIDSLDGLPLLQVVGSEVQFAANFHDTCGDVTAIWDFPGADSFDVTDPINPTSVYNEPGIYTVTLTVTDGCNSVSESLVVVIYDPTAGFTSGGGWFVPDNESFINRIAVTDTVSKANFGFIVKYKKGADNPDGNLEFRYRAGDIDLRSQDMDWLVVQSTTKVRFKGKATINGNDELHTFKVTAEDKGEPGASLDTFCIEIWLGVVDDVENTPQTPKHKAKGLLGGGNIQIHQK